MASPLGYVDPAYLKSAAQVLRALKKDSYDWMQAERSHRVLDLGCGPGTDTLALAERVGSDGMVVGIDRDPAMLKEAERRAREARLRDPDRALQRSVVRRLTLIACFLVGIMLGGNYAVNTAY